MNPDTIGCVWTGEFDLNTLRVDGEIFEPEKKKLRIQKYPDTCGRGLSFSGDLVFFSIFENPIKFSSVIRGMRRKRYSRA